VTKVADVLTMEYMSSDESEMDEKTHGHGVKQYNLRKFTWESGDLKRAKRKLDKSHHAGFVAWAIKESLDTERARGTIEYAETSQLSRLGTCV
jgi:hypothetical protein